MAETILLIHGMWAGPWCWENFQPVFEQQGYKCIAATLPFHDMAPEDVPDPRLGTSSLLDYAAAMEQKIRQIGSKPIVVGHETCRPETGTPSVAFVLRIQYRLGLRPPPDYYARCRLLPPGQDRSLDPQSGFPDKRQISRSKLDCLSHATAEFCNLCH